MDSNHLSAQWTARDESAPKRADIKISWQDSGIVFWHIYGIMFIDYLKNEKNINSNYYITLPERLKKRSHLKKKKVLFHKENKIKYENIFVSTLLSNLGPKRIFFCSRTLKEFFAGRKCCSNEEAKNKSYYENGIKTLYPCYNRCIVLEGKYIE